MLRARASERELETACAQLSIPVAGGDPIDSPIRVGSGQFSSSLPCCIELMPILGLYTPPFCVWHLLDPNKM